MSKVDKDGITAYIMKESKNIGLIEYYICFDLVVIVATSSET